MKRILHYFKLLPAEKKKRVHSVFSIKRNELVDLLDEAWLKRGDATERRERETFIVPFDRQIGTLGERKLLLVVKKGTSEVITAYPVR